MCDGAHSIIGGTRLDQSIVEWLMEGPAWIRYRVLLDVEGKTDADSEAEAARAAMLADTLLVRLMREVQDWPWPPLNSHKSAVHTIHKLSFLAEVGLRRKDRGFDGLVTTILSARSPQGQFQVPVRISPSYGGSGKDEVAWALCDLPLIAYDIALLDPGHGDAVHRAIEPYLAPLPSGGWGCHVSPKLGKFRGPGRKDDPCPLATLLMLQLCSVLPDLALSNEAKASAEVILSLWNESRQRHPYQFYMGTDFRKLKAPLVWYDILHVTDVLSRFPWLRSDDRLREMAAVIAAKADAEGRFTPESVWTAWAGWEFAQKTAPSRWVTFIIRRILDRMN
jgi:hypothetical protein